MRGDHGAEVGGAVIRRWPLLVALAGAVACGSWIPRRDRRWNAAHDERCAAHLAALAAGPRPAIGGISLRPAVLYRAAYHPHAGGDGCILAGLEPVEWARLDPDGFGDVVYADKDGPDPTYSTFKVSRAYGADPKDLERDVVAPARVDAVIVREDRDALAHTLVTRRSGALRLLSIRRDPRDGDVVHCEAYLVGAYEAALPAFEAACASMDWVPWEVGERRAFQGLR